MNYRVVNMRTGEMWEGKANSAAEVYKKISIKKGDTTVLSRGRTLNQITVKNH
jgi:hypothetical protein